MRILFAAVAGGLFGAGLLLSGMTDTTKVIGWLDLFGDWDPTLAFVMGGAIVPMALAWRFTIGRNPGLGGLFPPRPEPRLDRDLIWGSVLFGAGWGLAGLCPGPAIASLGFGGVGGIGFFLSMAAGMWLAPLIRRRLDAVVASV
jgi:uncharacterized membrane protein YedE/YeeE